MLDIIRKLCKEKHIPMVTLGQGFDPPWVHHEKMPETLEKVSDGSVVRRVI